MNFEKLFLFWRKLDCFKYLGTFFACNENLELIKGYFMVTFFSFFAGKVFFNSQKSIAKSSKLLNIAKNWLKKGQSLKKSSAFDSETNYHRPLTRTLISKWNKHLYQKHRIFVSDWSIFHKKKMSFSSKYEKVIGKIAKKY